MKKLGVVFVLCMLSLFGCDKGEFTSIQMEQPFIGSVNLKEDSLTFLNGKSLKEMSEWEINKPISGAVLFPDQDHLAVYGENMSEVMVYSLSEGKLIDKWQTGEGIVHISLINQKKELALVDQLQDSIRIFNLDGKEVRSKKVGDNPISMYEDQQANKMYVVNFNDEKITVLNPITLESLHEIKINPFSTGIMVRSNEKQIWVGGHGEGERVEENIHIYSTESGKLIKTIHASSMPMQFLELNNDIFVVSHGSSTVYKWNNKLEETGSLKVGVNPFEIKKYNNRLVVASYDSDDIHIINPSKFEIEKSIKVGKGPFQLIVRE